MAGYIKKVINLTLNGSVQRLTTDATIWVESFELQSANANAGAIFVGREINASSLPASVTKSTSIYDLPTAGSSVKVTYLDRDLNRGGGEQTQLSRYCVQGTNTDVLHIVYDERENF